MRAARFLALASLLALTACGRGGPEVDREATATEVPADMASNVAASGVVESEFGTPVKDRVATIGLLNKRNNFEQDLTIKSGQSQRVGNVVVKVASCERTAPWERPPEVGAFVQVFVEERAAADKPLAWRKIFSGWLFKNSPSLNVVEHPVYDVWVKACAMKFPGEEDEAAASASSAPNASGNASAAPAAPSPKPAAPKPSDSPKPRPSASASPN